MSKIVNFTSYNNYISYLKEQQCYKLIGAGTEGKCILSRNRKDLYKIIDAYNSLEADYDVNKIITTKDIELSHYIFPEELYILNNKLIGYKTKYIKEPNLFEDKILKKIITGKQKLNFDLLVTAYYEILTETNILSKEKILIYDLTWNLLFAKEHLYGIDTCGYKKIDDTPYIENKIRLDRAIKTIFNEALRLYSSYDEIVIEEIKKEKDIEKYIKKLKKII